MDAPIALTPDMYTPSVNDYGDYVDRMPIIRHGIYCPCGSRRDKVYDSASKFYSHTKTKAHQKWLVELNQNRANYYSNMLKHEVLIENQKKIIGHLENQLQKKSLTIDYLTEQLIALKPSSTYMADLLGLDECD